MVEGTKKNTKYKDKYIFKRFIKLKNNNKKNIIIFFYIFHLFFFIFFSYMNMVLKLIISYFFLFDVIY